MRYKNKNRFFYVLVMWVSSLWAINFPSKWFMFKMHELEPNFKPLVLIAPMYCNSHYCARLFSGLPDTYTAQSQIEVIKMRSACTCSLAKNWCAVNCQVFALDANCTGDSCKKCLEACSQEPASLGDAKLPINLNFYKNYQTFMQTVFTQPPPLPNADKSVNWENVDATNLLKEIKDNENTYLSKYSNDGSGTYHLFQLAAAALKEADAALVLRSEQIADISKMEKTKETALTKARDIVTALTQQKASLRNLLDACMRPSVIPLPAVSEIGAAVASTALSAGIFPVKPSLGAIKTMMPTDWCSKFDQNNQIGAWAHACCMVGWHPCAMQYALMRFELPKKQAALQVLQELFDKQVRLLQEFTRGAENFDVQIRSIGDDIAKLRTQLNTCIAGS